MRTLFPYAVAILFTVFLVGCQGTQQPAITTIAFASCAKASQGQEIWRSIRATDPDLFLFIGDNVYVDVPKPPTSAADFERTYAEFAQKQSGYIDLFESVPVYATWDDHDYGLNDAGKEFSLKDVAQQQFVEFFNLPEDSPVRHRPGVYDAHVFGPEGRRVQIILLDTRYFRDPLKRNPAGRPGGRGPYVPHTDHKKTLLGEAQWAWLEKQLKQPAELRVVATSIQFVNDEFGWECWGNFPHEQRRFYELIEKTKANGVVLISGDRHLTELSLEHEAPAPYPIFDLTSSGMAEKARPVREPNPRRVGDVYRQSNFGLIQIEWDPMVAGAPRITLESRDHTGKVLFDYAVELKTLQVDETLPTDTSSAGRAGPQTR